VTGGWALDGVRVGHRGTAQDGRGLGRNLRQPVPPNRARLGAFGRSGMWTATLCPGSPRGGCRSPRPRRPRVSTAASASLDRSGRECRPQHPRTGALCRYASRRTTRRPDSQGKHRPSATGAARSGAEKRHGHGTNTAPGTDAAAPPQRTAQPPARSASARPILCVNHAARATRWSETTRITCQPASSNSSRRTMSSV
jgi:hypothetical protein